MPGFKILDAHRTWEDWLGLGLGAVIWFSPKFAGQTIDTLVMWNTKIVGLAVLVLASLIHDSHSRGKEVAEVALGLWLVASPFALGYMGVGTFRYWHFGLGALVALLAALELFQDWKEGTPPAKTDFGT